MSTVPEGVFADVILVIAMVFEAVAAAVLLIGLVWAGVISLRRYRVTRSGRQAYQLMRQGFGGALLLGLEILVAGDLLRTVAVDPTIENVLGLGLIVVIRTFLSFSLEIEIEGVPPWRRALVSGASVMRRAAQESRGDADPPATPS